MLDKVVRKLVAVLLIVVCPSTFLMAEGPSAMLYGTGTVTLNGKPAAKSSSVFAGDRIDTANASVVSINRSGSLMVVDPNSSVEYQSDGLMILNGTTRVRTSKGLTVHAGPLSVFPKANSALFDVSRDDKTILVASREGALTLTDGVETATLAPGYTAKVTLDSQQDQGPKPAATTSGGNSHKGIIIAIIVSAAATAAIVCGIECGGGGRAPISPVMP